MKLVNERTNVEWLPKPHMVKQFVTADISSLEHVSAALVFAFKGEEVLLANVHSRGWDIPGGHIEAGETPEAAATRELFEETASSPIIMGTLGFQEINLKAEKPPAGYAYPFPISNIPFFWVVVGEIGSPSESMEVGLPKLFSYKEAVKLDSIKNHIGLFEAAFERAKLVNEKLREVA